MIYVISDIHGCYAEYRELLEKIKFSSKDTLYILGDVVDRGPEPIKVIQDMMKRPNVNFILGNHDYLMLMVMSKLVQEITEENIDSGVLNEDLLMDYYAWMNDGGEVTVAQFNSLERWEMIDILEYVQDALIYEDIQVNKKRFILTHAGIKDYSYEKDLDEYHFTDFIFGRMDYSKRHFDDPDTYLVSGHTPTVLIREDRQFLVYKGNGHIAIDCGCVSGGRLAAYCLDDGSITYVEANRDTFLEK